MKRTARRVEATGLLVTIAIAGCSAATRPAVSEGSRSASRGEVVLTPAAQAKADSGRPAYTAADVRFMQGMIRHHAQALLMAAWAPTHGARADLRTLAGRIDVAQRDEIAFMQRWLMERREAVPEATAERQMAGHDMSMHQALMPGMLTPEQLAQLEKATGPEFDRLFLTYMIQHHQGALTMVEQLFASPGAAQDVYVFRFASDVNADQNTEIDRMRTMLARPQRNQP
jgi:uncharacterized protein (DUF305 family)